MSLTYDGRFFAVIYHIVGILIVKWLILMVIRIHLGSGRITLKSRRYISYIQFTEKSVRSVNFKNIGGFKSTKMSKQGSVFKKKDKILST